MNLLSEAHIRKIYAQDVEAIVRLVHRLADRIEELEAQPIREPQPVIAALANELARTKQTLARQSRELRELHQLNHRLLRRIRELEREVEHGTAVARDSHNSSLPPSTDPPWQKVKRTKSLRQKSGRRVGGASLLYSTYLGGSALELGNDIAVDALGTAYVTGNTDSANFPHPGAYQPTLGGLSPGSYFMDAFVTKLVPTCP